MSGGLTGGGLTGGGLTGGGLTGGGLTGGGLSGGGLTGGSRHWSDCAMTVPEGHALHAVVAVGRQGSPASLPEMLQARTSEGPHFRGIVRP